MVASFGGLDCLDSRTSVTGNGCVQKVGSLEEIRCIRFPVCVFKV